MLVLPPYNSSHYKTSYVPCTPIHRSDGLPDSVLPRLLARRWDWTNQNGDHHFPFLLDCKPSGGRRCQSTLGYWFTLSCIDQYSPLLHINYALDFFISSVGIQAFTHPTRYRLGKPLPYQLSAEKQVNHIDRSLDPLIIPDLQGSKWYQLTRYWPVRHGTKPYDLHVLRYLDTHPVVSWLNTYRYILSQFREFDII